MSNVNDIYAPLRCPHRSYHAMLLALILAAAHLFPNLVSGQYPLPQYELDEVVVIASRIPTPLDQLARNVVIFNREDIQSMPIHSIPELLEYAAGVDVRQRGPHGIQADVTIRGGTFEQTLVVLDGVPFRNSQTGHHNMDLPITLGDIERVEILKGPGTRTYGPNAYAGVINIITRQGGDRQAKIAAFTGTYGLKEGALSLGGQLGGLLQRLGTSLGYRDMGVPWRFSVSKKVSNGYEVENHPQAQAYTDFDITTLAYGTAIPVGPSAVNLTAGFTRKDFGAYSFYSERYPLQREKTTAGYIQAGTQLTVGHFLVSPAIYLHSHTDTFRIVVGDQWYRNGHKTITHGAEIRAMGPVWRGIAAFGVEVSRDTIQSNNLGDHARTTMGLYAEYRLVAGSLTFSTGVNAQGFSDWGWQASPGLDVNVRLSPSFTLYGSLGQAFRIPTYTELYYTDPANLGNAGLQPETSLTYDLGLNWRRERAQAGLALFQQRGRDIIDWGRREDTQPWQVDNITRIHTTGLEVNAQVRPRGSWRGLPLPRLQASYTYLKSDLDATEPRSKYVLDHLRHKFLLALTYPFSRRLTQDIRLRYEDRLGVGTTPFTLVDTRLTLSLGNLTGILEATNLLNVTYTDAGFVPMPGRWVRLGLQVDLIPPQ